MFRQETFAPIIAVFVTAVVGCGGEVRGGASRGASGGGSGAGGLAQGQSGGISLGVDCQCPLLTCGPRQQLVIEPGQCCPTCGLSSGAVRCDPQYCPTGGTGVPCCVGTDGTCGKDQGAGCLTNTPMSASCDPAACPSYAGQAACCTNGYCGLDWGNGCGVEQADPQRQCVGAQDMCGADKALRSCECECLACPTEWDYCVNDDGCYQIMICESGANCAGANCYKPETCQKVIDSQGGPSGLSTMMAEVLNACSVRSGCALSVAGRGR